jgi:hypothetical protein
VQTDIWRSIAQYLQPIALTNPRLAVMLARGQPIQPQVYTMGLEWDTGAVGTDVENHFAQPMMNPALVTGMTYTLQSEGWLAGSFLKPIAENFRNSGPTYINLEMRMEGPDRYYLTKNPTPIENIGVSGANRDRNFINNGWVIDDNANLYIKGYLARTFVAEEVPLLLMLSITMLELSGCNLRSIGFNEAVCALRKMGLYPSTSGVPQLTGPDPGDRNDGVR